MVLFLQSWSETAGLSCKSSSPKDNNFSAGWGHSCIRPGDRHPDPVYHPQPVWGLCCSYHRTPPQYHHGLHKVCQLQSHWTVVPKLFSMAFINIVLFVWGVQNNHIYRCTIVGNPVTSIGIYAIGNFTWGQIIKTWFRSGLSWSHHNLWIVHHTLLQYWQNWLNFH